MVCWKLDLFEETSILLYWSVFATEFKCRGDSKLITSDSIKRKFSVRENVIVSESHGAASASISLLKIGAATINLHDNLYNDTTHWRSTQWSQ